MEVKVEKGLVIRLSEEIASSLGVKEGDVGSVSVEGSKLIIDFTRDPMKLALQGPKFASIRPEEVEAISLEEQKRRIASSP